jgi:chloride channel 3/4/5
MASKSTASFHTDDGDDSYHQEHADTYSSTTPTSPTLNFRRLRPRTASDTHLNRHDPTERSSLLGNAYGSRSYTSIPGTGTATPRPHFSRHQSQLTARSERRRSRAPSFSGRSGRTFSQRLVHALGAERRGGLGRPFPPAGLMCACN